MKRLGVFVTPGKTLDAAVDRVQIAERLGYEAAFTTHIAGRDSMVVLSVFGAATSTIKIGTGVVPAFPRHPIVLAQEAVTVDEISNGRLILGVGPSHKITMETWFDIPMDKPFSRMKEYVAILRSIFTTGHVSFQGDFYKTQWAFMGYEARKDLPIYVSALAPNMLRWAGEAADGVILWGCMPSYIRSTVTPLVREGEKAAGRAPGTVEIVAAVPTALTTNRETAYDGLRKDFLTYMTLPFYRRAIDGAGFGAEIEAFDKALQAGDHPGALSAMSEGMLDAFGAIGDAAAIKAKHDEYRDAGVTLPCVGMFNAGDGFVGFEETLEAAIS